MTKQRRASSTQCKLTGRKVPDEVSICGFTDGAIAQSTDPKLTTVEQHGEEVGKSTIRLLIDKLEGNDEGKSGIKSCVPT